MSASMEQAVKRAGKRASRRAWSIAGMSMVVSFLVVVVASVWAVREIVEVLR